MRYAPPPSVVTPPPSQCPYAPIKTEPCDEALLPPRPWIHGTQLLRRKVTQTIQPSESNVTYGMALAVASGRPLLGETVFGGAKRVWFIETHDYFDEFERNIHEVTTKYKDINHDIKGNLYVSDVLTSDAICKAEWPYNGPRILEPISELIQSETTRLGIDVLIVNPFVSSYEHSDNFFNLICAAVRRWSKIAYSANCAVLLVHHSWDLADSLHNIDPLDFEGRW